jgi:hypothetical protein
MPIPIVEPVQIQRAAQAGETVTQDFIVNIVPNGTLTCSILNGESIFRLKYLVAYQPERKEFTEEEINELPPFPTSLRQKARLNGYLVYNEIQRVGPNQPLTVWNGLLVKGEIEFAPSKNYPLGGVSAVLAIDTNQGRYAEIPLLLIVGTIQIDYAVPVYAHQGQKTRLPVTVTFPPDCPATIVTLSLGGPKWTIPMKAVDVPVGSSGTAVLDLIAESAAPLGPVSTNLRVTGFDGPYDTMVPFQFEIKPFSLQVQATEEIEAKAKVAHEGPPGLRNPISDVKDAGNDGFVQEFTSGNIYWHPQIGAKWVYGKILIKYLGLGGPGGFLKYPLTDETGTPDGKGRYNHFQAGAIYCSAETGAHELHGKIRDHWASLGSEMSYLGYPTADQTGNTSRFQRGTIEIKPLDGTTRDEPDSRSIQTGTIHTPDGAACRGSAELIIFSTGRCRYLGSITATGFPGYDVSLGVAFDFKDSQGQSIAIMEEGDVEGWGILGGSKWHEWDRTYHHKFIADNFDALRTANWTALLRVEHGPAELTKEIATWVGSIVSLIIVVYGWLSGGGSGGGNYKLCCRLGATTPSPMPGSEVERECILVPKHQPCPPEYPLG